MNTRMQYKSIITEIKCFTIAQNNVNISKTYIYIQITRICLKS